MKMKKYSFIALLIVVLLGGSCSKDFLKPEPLSFYAPENTFIDANGLNTALIACLRNARHEFYGDGTPIISELIFSDVAVEGTTDKTGPAMDLPAQILPDAELNNTDYNKVGWYWVEGYNRIKYANTVISRIDNATCARGASPPGPAPSASSSSRICTFRRKRASRARSRRPSSPGACAACAANWGRMPIG